MALAEEEGVGPGAQFPPK